MIWKIYARQPGTWDNPEDYAREYYRSKVIAVGWSQRSGTSWEIDAKGFRSGDAGFVIVECRRYTTSTQNQEKLGGLAYRIIDTEGDA